MSAAVGLFRGVGAVWGSWGWLGLFGRGSSDGGVGLGGWGGSGGGFLMWEERQQFGASQGTWNLILAVMEGVMLMEHDDA